MIFEIFCLHVTGYSNTKESFPSYMFVVMAAGKCELHTYFTILQRILTSTHMKKFNIFLQYICRDVKHSLFKSRLVLKFPSKLLLGKDMFTLIFVEIENETSISILELEMMKVLK